MASTCCWTSNSSSSHNAGSISSNSRSIRNLSSCCCRASETVEGGGRERGKGERENRFSTLDLSCVGSPLACLPAFCPGAFEAHRDSSSSPSFCCSSVLFFSDQRISLAAKQTNDKWTETERSKETEQNPPRTGHKTPQEAAVTRAGAGTGANLLVPVSQQQQQREREYPA